MSKVKEIWLPANVIENVEVSNYGNLREVLITKQEKYAAVKEDGVYKKKLVKCKLIKSYIPIEPRIHNEYYCYKNFPVHILVAKLFIPNPDGLPEVNHKKGNKLDNRAWMLEWCTSQYNTCHAIYELGHVTTFGIKKVRVFKDGVLVCELPSVSEAARFAGGQSTQVSRVLSGLRTHYKGYQFEYAA